jgi:uncharacterized protein YraI
LERQHLDPLYAGRKASMLKTTVLKRLYRSIIQTCLILFLLQGLYFSCARLLPVYAQSDPQTTGNEPAPPSGFAIASFTINGGCLVTDIHEVNLQLAVEGETAALVVRYANEGADWSEWEPYQPGRRWLLPAGDGPRTVHAQVRDGGGSTASASAHIFIHLPVTGITLDKAEMQLQAGGQPARLQALVQPADATAPQVYWSSSNKSVAVVKEGLVIPAGPGEAIITAAAGSCRASCLVTVEPACSISGPAAPSAEITCGDVNGSGEVNVVDAALVLRAAAGLLELDPLQAAAADVYRDGQVNIKDAVFILRFITGQLETLPVDPDDEEEPAPVTAPPFPSFLPPTQKMLDAVYRVSTTATVLDNRLNVRAGPGTNYAILGVLEPGTRVTVYEKIRGSDPDYPDWYRILYDGRDGYIAADYVSISSVLYGLDFQGQPVYLCAAPVELQPGDYKINQDYAFFRLEGSSKVPTGVVFYFLEHTPYATLYLEHPAGEAITAEYLAQRANQIRSDSPFKNLGGAFIQAQETWGVNALYLMAHAALESAWGTSSIARSKNNIYGFMAYDDDPYGRAAVFRSMADCIMHCSAYIRREYHSHGGSWYNGAHLVGMNVRYATDRMWAFKLANAMQTICPYSAYEHAEKHFRHGQATANMHLREAPGTGSGSLAVIPEGAAVTLRGMTLTGDSHWFNVLHGELAGWSSGTDIDLVDAPRAAVYLPGWYKAGNENLKLNVRSAPSTAGGVVDQLPFGAVFQITEIAMSYDPGAGKWYAWYRISYPGSAEQSWVRGDYVIIDW